MIVGMALVGACAPPDEAVSPAPNGKPSSAVEKPTPSGAPTTQPPLPAASVAMPPATREPQFVGFDFHPGCVDSAKSAIGNPSVQGTSGTTDGRHCNATVHSAAAAAQPRIQGCSGSLAVCSSHPCTPEPHSHRTAVGQPKSIQGMTRRTVSVLMVPTISHSTNWSANS